MYRFINHILFILLIALGNYHAMGQNGLILEKLSDKINSDIYDEITPVLSSDGKMLCFTRVGDPNFTKTLIEGKTDLSKTLGNRAYKRKLSNIYSQIADTKISNPFSSDYNQDIWIAYAENEVFSVVTHPGYPLNNALPNSICAITPDDQGVIVLNQFSPEGGLGKGFSISNKESFGNFWSFPFPLFIDDYSNDGTDAGLTLSTDAHVIIMTIDKKNGHGQNDLYVSFRIGPYSWSKPMNLGSDINTSFRETTPHLAIDKSTIYFSSNRPGSMGGNDIYFSKRLDDTWTKWSKPEPMQSPINSSSDDSQPFLDFNSGYLYFSSKRNGSSDIFRVRVSTPLKETVTLKGIVYNPKNKERIEGAKILKSRANSEDFHEVSIASDGSYKIEISKGEAFDIKAVKDGHFSSKKTVEFNKDYVYFKDYNLDLSLEPMERGTKINLKPIYFVQSKAIILPESFPALDELATFLKKNNRLYITIEGHTDNRGTEEDLLRLSEDRASAIKDYLIYSKRIKPVRLSTIGYGSSRPVNQNSSEEDRAINRRVEVIIDNVSVLLSN